MPNNINHKHEEDLTTEEKVALEGKPRLGTIPRVQINIRESDEFKVGLKLKKCLKYGLFITF